MIAKLIKTNDREYHLETKEFDGIHLSCYPHDITKQKLSLRNCQEIAEGNKETNEWGVFIIMACGKTNGCDETNCDNCQIEPSLDDNGCLKLTQLRFQK